MARIEDFASAVGNVSAVQLNSAQLLPMNYANNLNGLEFKSKDLNTTSSIREAPQAQSSKKRKLVEQLEVSVPVIRDLVTPVEQKSQSEEEKEEKSSLANTYDSYSSIV